MFTVKEKRGAEYEKEYPAARLVEERGDADREEHGEREPF